MANIQFAALGQNCIRELNAWKRRIERALKAGLREWAGTAKEAFITRRLMGMPGIEKRSGALIRSFRTPKVTGGAIDDIQATLYSDSIYARTQEGLVGPYIWAHSKRMAIPVGPALKASGARKYQSPRDVPKGTLHYIPGKKGGGFLVDKDSRLWYILRWVVRGSPRDAPLMEFRKTIASLLPSAVTRMQMRLNEVLPK